MKISSLAAGLLLLSTYIYAQNENPIFAISTDLDKAIASIDIKSSTVIRKLLTINYEETTDFNNTKYIRICNDLNGGIWTVNDFYVAGFLKMVGHYSDIKKETKEGHFKYYHPYNILEAEGEYSANLQEGEWRYYSMSGSLSAIEVYSKGVRISEEYYNENGSVLKDKRKANVEASFKGKSEALGEFLSENLSFPIKKFTEEVKGTVNLSFTIDIDGSLQDIKVVKSLGPKIDEEVLRVVRLMPKWIPARKHNVITKENRVLAVKVSYD